ncbi:PREDICTED: transcription factor bHLH57-like isoform X2 [Tarenaya hassleriana]|nr:PREDICTED: transcription factor bHLH57-like isoform X2 [Tarenaya hassleriana]
MDADFSEAGCSQHELLLSSGSFRFSDEAEEEAAVHVQFSDAATIEDSIPFLRMLKSVKPTTFLPFKSEPNILQSLLQIQTLEPESCLTLESISPGYCKPFKLESPPPPPPAPSSAVELPNESVKERRKRKRMRAPKNEEEVENQRMTHIAIERNRRRQMNEHLNSLKCLIPQSYLQRGDQASIIGGAIDFVKQLEQLLHSLEAKKRVENGDENEEKMKSVSSRASASVSDEGLAAGRDAAEVDTAVIQNHVSLKVWCKRRQGQTLRAIVSLEELKLTVLHLNVTSSLDSVFYSFNLKMEDDCELGSADEITTAVRQIFKHINGERCGQPLVDSVDFDLPIDKISGGKISTM